jgi:hypothetical protein
MYDTYLSVMTSCDIGVVDYELDPTTGDTLYAIEGWLDLIAENDDANGDYSSEATFCVVAGQEYIIAWPAMYYYYYYYGETFDFTITEFPDITTPVNVSALGNEDGIAVSWDPIPAGCAEVNAPSRSSSIDHGVGRKYGATQFKLKPGAPAFVYSADKKRDLVRQDVDSRDAGPAGPSLTRDCPADQSTISMYTAGGSWASERSWEVYAVTVNADGGVDSNLVASGLASAIWTGCLPNGNYTVNGFDSFADGWNGGLFYVDGPGGNIEAIDLVPAGGFGSANFEIDVDFSIVYGCTDETSCKL